MTGEKVSFDKDALEKWLVEILDCEFFDYDDYIPHEYRLDERGDIIDPATNRIVLRGETCPCEEFNEMKRFINERFSAPTQEEFDKMLELRGGDE